MLLREWSSRNVCNSSSIAGLNVWLLKRTAFKLIHNLRNYIATLCTVQQRRKQSKKVIKLISYKFVVCGINVVFNTKNILHLVMFIIKNVPISTDICAWMTYHIRDKLRKFHKKTQVNLVCVCVCVCVCTYTHTHLFIFITCMLMVQLTLFL